MSESCEPRGSLCALIICCWDCEGAAPGGGHEEASDDDDVMLANARSQCCQPETAHLEGSGSNTLRQTHGKCIPLVATRLDGVMKRPCAVGPPLRRPQVACP